MTTVTLDFSTSYRAITDADILPIMTRDPFGWNGLGEPEAAVKLISNDGTVTDIPATNGDEGIPAFYVNHSAGDNQIDLIDNLDKSYLRFEVAVDGPPIWENFVDPVYTGTAELQTYFNDTGDYLTAYDDWVNYVMSHEFRASAAAYSDKGGALGQFTATDALVIEDFTTAPQFFPVIITGSAFNDNFSGGALDDALIGENGNDTEVGGAGNDQIYGGSGGDLLNGQAGEDTVYGGQGADFLYGDDGNDAMTGNGGNDTLNGGAGVDELYGTDGNDELHGQIDDDQLYGGNGQDLIYGDAGNDALTGGALGDTLNGGAGNDTLAGDAGDDGLSGGDGNDLLAGGDGLDFLRGGAGKDVLTGGAGNDAFDFDMTGTANADRITDFQHGADKIWLESGAFAGVHATVDPQELRLGTVALDGDDRIIYDQTTGRLYYDADGNRHGAQSAPQVLFAIIANHALLTIDDFLVH